MWTRVNDLDRMFGVMDLLQSQLNRLYTDFDKIYEGESTWRATNGTPKTNLYDDGNHFTMQAEVPGMTKDEISIKIQGNYLELSGTRKSDAPEGYKAHRIEREAASFTRSFTLPSDVDVDKVNASLKNGILSLTLPKAEAAKPKQVSIA